MFEITGRHAPAPIRPKTFLESCHYLLAVSGHSIEAEPLMPVKFVKYDPCPAFVLIETPDGTRCRWNRDDLRDYLDEAKLV